MPAPTRPAFSLPLAGTVPEQRDLARRDEALGYRDVWLAETAGPDAFALATLVAEATSALRIGTCVVPVYTRSPAVLAAAAGTVSQVAGPGRFVLGLGASSPAIVDDWSGVPFDAPLTRVRETVEVVRRMLAGEKVEFRGKTVRSRNFRLGSPPAGPVPIWLAAQRPMMARLAGELGDGGVCTNFIPAAAVPRLLTEVRAGAAAAGRDASQIEVVARLSTIVTDDKQAGFDLLRGFFGAYLATPVYNPFLAWCGFEDEARMIREGWAAKDRAKTAAGVTDTIIDQVAIVGDVAECKDKLARFVEAGITVPMLNPIAADAASAALVLEALAP